MSLIDEGVKNLNESCGTDRRAFGLTARAFLQNMTIDGKFRAPLNCEDKKADQSFCCSPYDAAQQNIDDSGTDLSDPRTRQFTSELKHTFTGEGSHDNFGPELQMWHRANLNACAQNKCSNTLSMPCVLLQSPGDQHGLVLRSWRRARAAPI